MVLYSHSTLDDIRADAFDGEVVPTHGVPWRAIVSFLKNEGWQRKSVKLHSYRYHEAPNILLEQLRQRIWSRTWFTDEACLERVYEKMERILKTNYADPAQPSIVEAGFTIEVYTPPYN